MENSLEHRDMSDFEERFGAIGRLFGQPALSRLGQAHVCVIGLGGVGSWAVEALARSGVGRLTLVDMDDVCVTNINRQLPALQSTVGRSKASVLAERCALIHPDAQIQAEELFFNATTCDALLSHPYDYLVDAIDNVPNKCLLLSECLRRGLPVVTTGGAGGRLSGHDLKVADLAFTTNDRLLQQVRRRLRERHGFPVGQSPFGIECVYSTAAPVFPSKDGGVCEAPEHPDDARMNCDTGYGSATFVTGAFGFAAAGLVVRRLAGRAPSQTAG